MRSEPVAVPERFAGARVLVSGAASGIGRASALRFASEGAHVLAGDIDIAGLETLRQEAASESLELETFALDQASELSVGDLSQRLAGEGLDVACVNAGIANRDARLEDVPADDWDRLHRVNLRGAFLVARAVVPPLRTRGSGGSIVFTASTSGMRAHPMAAAYAATKSGLLGLSRSLALELAGERIRVNCVCPGSVDTPLVDRVYGPNTDEILQLAADAIPLRRVALPEDVAAAISFLSSGDARHLTAVELVVDGGQAARL